MKEKFGRFNSKEKKLLILAMLLFFLGAVLVCVGREWAVLSLIIYLIHAFILLKVMFSQAETILQLEKEKDDIITGYHKENLAQRVVNLREDIMTTRSESKRGSV